MSSSRGARLTGEGRPRRRHTPRVVPANGRRSRAGPPGAREPAAPRPGPIPVGAKHLAPVVISPPVVTGGGHFRSVEYSWSGCFRSKDSPEVFGSAYLAGSRPAGGGEGGGGSGSRVILAT